MNSEDKAFEEWISRRVLEETAEMIKDMEKDPELDKFEHQPLHDTTSPFSNNNRTSSISGASTTRSG